MYARRAQGPLVLVSDGGYGQSKPSLAAVRALARAGYRPVVTVSGSPSMAAASRDCAGRLLVPSADDDPLGYAAATNAALATGRYLCLLPTSDPVVKALCLPSHDLLDKDVLAVRATDAGLRCPPARIVTSGEDLMNVARELDWPVVIKAARYHAVHLARSAPDLNACRRLPGPLLIQPFIDQPQYAVSGVMWDGVLRAAVHQRYLRTWPAEPGGHAAAVVTTTPDLDLEARVAALLVGHQGPFQAQLRGPYLLDLNPRVSTSLPLAVAAGANLAEVYMRFLQGEEPDFARARPGVLYRWLDGDLRSIAWSWRKGRLGLREVASALRPHVATVHGPESLRDPGPILVRGLHGAIGQRSARSRREAIASAPASELAPTGRVDDVVTDAPRAAASPSADPTPTTCGDEDPSGAAS